ncbi:MAG: HD domain-containing protein [Clostridiales bacterium]|nr:HD domain-containing protein [Clostridiales bacterium]
MIKGKNEKILIKNDIYDKYGRIYITKGTHIVVDEERKEFFQEIGIWDQIRGIEAAFNREKEHKLFQDETMKIKQRYHAVDEKSFNKAVTLISDIMFEDDIFKKIPYLNTLAEYATWYYTHSINVAITSVLLAENLGFSKTVIKEIAIGALLHDIGVIFVDQEILEKIEWELNEEELDIKKKHCVLGVKAVKAVRIPHISEVIIEQHHEKLDGSGYPMQLKGEEILSEAHIVGIADTFDTKTTYKSKVDKNDINEVLDEMYNLPERYNQEYIKVLIGFFHEDV